MKSKSLILVSLWKSQTLRSTLPITLEAQFICHPRHWMIISTVSRVIFGLWESSSLKCLQEKLHGEPKLRKNLEDNSSLSPLNNYYPKISVGVRLTSWREPWIQMLTIEWVPKNSVDFLFARKKLINKAPEETSLAQTLLMTWKDTLSS